MRRRVALIGLGLHAARAYLPALARHVRTDAVELVAVVELRAERERVHAALAAAGLHATTVIDIDEAAAAGPDGGTSCLDRSLPGRIDAVIISIDPRQHAPYLRWAARHGIDALVDKPITAHALDGTEHAARRLATDYAEVVAQFERSGAVASVMVPFRRHRGTELVRAVLGAVADATGVPVTYLDVYRAYGYWNWPDEFFTRENHPYRYGYGVLLHGGYHAVDLAASLMELNRARDPAWADAIEVFARACGPDDVMAQVPLEFYADRALADGLDPAFSPAARRQAAAFGETDVNIALTARKEHRVVTVGSVRILETAFSRRAWRALPTDTYKANGKQSQLRLTAHIAHLATIHAWDEFDPADGTRRRFVVEVLRNARLAGGAEVERHVLCSPPSGSLTEQAKDHLLDDWLRGKGGDLVVGTHRLAVGLLSAAYVSVAKGRRGEVPITSIPASGG